MKKQNLFRTRFGIITLTSGMLLAPSLLKIFLEGKNLEGTLSAQPTYLWAGNTGSTTDDFGNSIAVDGSGNVYSTGQFTGTADFDPGAGTANLTSSGSYDIFFAKYNASGAYLWAKNIGSTGSDLGQSIAVDGSGNVYITGPFTGTVDFDPGVGTANLSALGAYDTYFAKYDALGAYLWAKLIASSTSVANSIAVDGSGNVYLTGYFASVADFDPGPGTAIINATSTLAGSYDIFFAKYDASGAYLWAKNIGSAGLGSAGGVNTGNSIAVDTITGNVYITGYFDGTADFDPGAGAANLTPVGDYDIFFAKYDASGAYLWAKNIGGTSYDIGCSIAVDGNGNVYITGYFGGTADFDPGAGTANLNASAKDIFFAKYDGSGAYLWANSIVSAGYSDIGNSITVDGSGNVYITGYFEGTADFDPGAGNANLTPIWSYDIFFAKYDGSGAYLWAKNIGSANGGDGGKSIVVDGSGNNVYIGGSFDGTADFDPGAGTANLTSAGGLSHDIFFAKYSNTVTGVQQPSFAASDIIIYPTVSSGVFRLSTLFPFRDAMVEVYSVIGEKIYETPIQRGEAQLSLHSLGQGQIIDLSSQPDGVYFLTVKTEKGFSTQKLIIQ